jgi:hypothetical protein
LGVAPIELTDGFLIVSFGPLDQGRFVVVHLKTPWYGVAVFSCTYYTAKAAKKILATLM